MLYFKSVIVGVVTAVLASVMWVRKLLFLPPRLWAFFDDRAHADTHRAKAGVAR